MKYILPILLIAFCSCSYHVYLTKSIPNISRDSTYVFENDTVKISYNFWSNRGVCKFNIYNKLSIPLFIDWKNSALIINNNTNPYWKDETTTQSATVGAYGRGAYGSSSYGKQVHADRLSSIPAHAQITKTHNNFFLEHNYPSKEDFHKHVRNYIAYSTYEDFHNENFADMDFEIVTIKKTSNINSYKDSRNFYTGK